MTSPTTLAHSLVRELEAGKPMDRVLQSLAAYLIEEKQVGQVNSIIREVQRLQLEDHGIVYVQLTSAFPVSGQQLQEIESTFKTTDHAKKVIFETVIDPTVIGGVRCETADQRLDLTVRRQLQRLSTVNTSTEK